MNCNYDVLIVGGGLVGASLACALEPLIRTYRLRVALVECHDPAQMQQLPSFDARASALAFGTHRIYQQIGIWESIVDQAEPILEVHVSDRGCFGATQLSHREEDVPALGYVVENCRLGRALLDRLSDLVSSGTVEQLAPAEVLSVQPQPNSSMKVTVDMGQQGGDGGRIEALASLVVIADGGRSGLAEQLGISYREQNYHQYALIANLELDRPHCGVAWERFSSTGPMALLPMQGNRSALVWTLPEEEFDSRMAMDDEHFLELLQSLFGYRAGCFVKMGKRSGYPLSLRVAREQVRPGLAILGNAAHTLHPVAGQGYNLAIRDTMALVENISSSLAQGTVAGDLSRLLEYQKTVHADQTTTLHFCDGLIKLFSRREWTAVAARNAGLCSLDQCRPFKRMFARKAMGL